MLKTAPQAKLLVIACGALAHEIVWLQKQSGWGQIEVQCLDAELHNRPKLIPQKLRATLKKVAVSISMFLSVMVTVVLVVRSIELLSRSGKPVIKKSNDYPVLTVTRFMQESRGLMISPIKSWGLFTSQTF